MTAPVVFTWDGETMRPHPAFAKLCDRQFVCGENYQLIQHEDRSKASHGQYFASLHDKWLTLPENLQDEYPTEESLRKKALIRCNYFTQKDFVLPSNSAALLFAASLIEEDEECYSIIEVRGRVVRKSKALSQSYRAMGKQKFQKSKQDVLDFVDRLLGIEPQNVPLAPAAAPPLSDHQNERADTRELARVGRGRV